MADINEYLDWRGDIPFSFDGFNEVDSLILSQITYTDMEGIMTIDDELTLADAAKLYFEIHTEEELRARDTFFKLAPLLLKKASQTDRFKDIRISHYINLISKDRDEQYAAMTFILPDGVNYVSFRGTDNTLIGWKEDFNLFFMNETSGQKRATEYLNLYFKDTDCKLLLGGHSKGGNFAVYAGAFCDKAIQDRIMKVYSHDGPGFREEVLERDGYKRILPKIISLLPEESIVGMLLSNEYDNRIIRCDSHGINQHDPMTWNVYGKSFVYVEGISEKSKVIDKTMVTWLEGLNDEDRASFTDELFAALEATGAKTLGDISSGGMKSVSDFVKYLKELPPEKQQEFSDVIKSFIRIGSDILAKEVKGKLPKMSVSNIAITKVAKERQLLMDEKNAIRQEITSKRKAMSEEEVDIKSKAICEAVMRIHGYNTSDVILAYMSFGNEVCLDSLIEKAVADGKKVYIPKVEGKDKMNFYLYDGNLSIGSFGIREPAVTGDDKLYDPELERLLNKDGTALMLVPGVAFDMNRNRLGHGGGFYDRYMAKLKGYPVRLVGVGYEYQVVDELVTEEHDIRLDALITEDRIIR